MIGMHSIFIVGSLLSLSFLSLGSLTLLIVILYTVVPADYFGKISNVIGAVNKVVTWVKDRGSDEPEEGIIINAGDVDVDVTIEFDIGIDENNKDSFKDILPEILGEGAGADNPEELPEMVENIDESAKEKLLDEMAEEFRED